MFDQSVKADSPPFSPIFPKQIFSWRKIFRCLVRGHKPARNLQVFESRNEHQIVRAINQLIRKFVIRSRLFLNDMMNIISWLRERPDRQAAAASREFRRSHQPRLRPNERTGRPIVAWTYSASALPLSLTASPTTHCPRFEPAATTGARDRCRRASRFAANRA